MIAREVCADRRIRARFGDGVCWVGAGPESTIDVDGWSDFRYRRIVRLSGGVAPPFHHWVLAEEDALRRYRRLLLVIEDVREGRLTGRDLCSDARGHVSLMTSTDVGCAPAGAVVVEVDAAAVERAAEEWFAVRVGALPDGGQDRLAELGMFAAGDSGTGEEIPAGLVRGLWRVTAGLSVQDAETLYRQMAQLGLVHLSGGTGVCLDPVVRALMRLDRGEPWFASVTATLLDDLATRLSRADPLIATGPDRCWWELDPANSYLWEYLVTHLLEAGQRVEAELLAGDLRWVAARVARTGPAGPLRDLVMVTRATPARDDLTPLRDGYERTADRLDPTDPPEAVLDSLLNGLQYHERWGKQARLLQASVDRPILVNRWRPTDDPHKGRVPCGGPLWGFDISPSGILVAVAGGGKFVSCLDTANGEVVVRMKCYSNSRDVAFSPDGTWLAVYTQRHQVIFGEPAMTSSVQVWDLVTGTKRFETDGWGDSNISSMAISADSTRIAVQRGNGIQVWDWATQHEVPVDSATDLGPWRPAYQQAATSPDGAWRASVHDAELRFWDLRMNRPGPMTRVGPTLHSVQWLPDTSGIVAAGDRGLYVFDLKQPNQEVARESYSPETVRSHLDK